MASGTGNLPNQNMSFSPFAILTAEEMNDLVENIESLADGTGIGDEAIGTTQLADGAVTPEKTSDIWWEELGRTTLGVAGDTIAVSFTPKKYLTVMIKQIPTGGTADISIRFNSDSGNNYARTFTSDGGADSQATSQSLIQAVTTGSSVRSMVIHPFENTASREKIFVYHVALSIAGASNAVFRIDGGAKWANTTSQISSINVFNSGGTGDFAIGSEVIVLGHD